MAYLTGAADADVLTAGFAKSTPDIVGTVLGLAGRVRHAYFLKRRGDAKWSQEADEVLRQGREELAAGGERARTHLNMNAAFTLKGDREAAIASLGRAVKDSYLEYAFLTPDPIFAPIRTDPRFTAFIEEMTAEIARQRRRAADRGLLDLESLAPGIK